MLSVFSLQKRICVVVHKHLWLREVIAPRCCDISNCSKMYCATCPLPYHQSPIVATPASRIIAPPTVLRPLAGCQGTRFHRQRQHVLTLPLACSETSAQTHHPPSRSQPHREGPLQAPQQAGHKRQARLHRSAVSSADTPLAPSVPRQLKV